MNTQDNPVRHIEPTQNAGRAFNLGDIEGSFFMLNLLRFREIADNSHKNYLGGIEPRTATIEHARLLPFTQPPSRFG